MRKAGLEFKVGVFVLLALAVLAGLVTKAGDFYWKPGYVVRIVFPAASGIEAGSPVKLAGVTVGEVQEIYVVRGADGQTQVELRCWINQGVYLEEDAEPRLTTMGLLGEKYVEIFPGTSGNKPVGNQGLLAGRSASSIDDVMNSGQRLIRKMETVMDQVNQVVADPEFKAHVKGTFVHADKLAASLSDASDDLKDTIKSAKIVMGRLRDGEGTVGKLLKEDKIAKDLEALAADLRAHPWKLFKKS